MKMSWKMRVVGVLLAVMFNGGPFGSPSAVAQTAEEEGPATTESPQAESALEAAKIWLTHQAETPAEGYTLPMLTYRASLASADGNYLAQDADELATYNDLGITFQYIDEPVYREILKLPAQQGVIVYEVDPGRAGFQNGFRQGDIVMQVDDTNVVTQYDVVIELARQRGETRRAKIRRDGVDQLLQVTLEPVQSDQQFRWVIGVTVDEPSETLKSQLDTDGVVVTSVTEGHPADEAGVQVHDVIVDIDGSELSSLDDLKAAVADAGDSGVTLDIIRASKRLRIDVTPRRIPVEGQTLARWASPEIDAYQRAAGAYRLAWDLTARDLVQLPQAAAVEGEWNTGAPGDGLGLINEKLDQLIDDLTTLKAAVDELKSGK